MLKLICQLMKMEFVQIIVSLTFIFRYALFLPLANGEHCSYSSCLTKSSDTIGFPFRSPDQPLSCGLPGFDLICNGSTPLLNFPSGQSFAVESVSNSAREIEVSAKTGACLEEELTRFNSSGTPFYPKGFTRFIVYACPSTVEYLGTFIDPYTCAKIHCPGREGEHSVFYCDASVDYRSAREHGCNQTGVANVAGTWASPFSLGFATSFYLTWDIPRECTECASKGKDCRRDPRDSTLIKCFDKPSKTSTRIIVSVAVILPILSIILCVIYIRRKKVENLNQHAGGRLNNTPVAVAHGTNVGSTYVSYPTTTSGVEQATLNTYPIIVIGNSGRILINMEDKICPICLSNYEPKDILKSLPECLHRFHSDCIDEWLYEKAVCPICRTVPPLTSS